MSRTLFTSRSGGDLKLLTNRQSLRESLSLNHLHFMHQSHSDRVLVVDEQPGEFDCDALVTTTPGVGLGALAADCMPITFSSERVVAVAHVGRVGLFNEIALKTVTAMKDLGATSIEATIGPSICGQCYEVSTQMYLEGITQIPATATSLKRHALNLQSGVTHQLESVGVRVKDLSLCTLENPLYFSFRRGSESARQAGIISL